MSLPTDPLADLVPDQHADPLVASAVRAAADVPAAGCPDAELLALYAERALSTSDLALVHPHLDGCPRCQAIVAACVRTLPEPSETSFAPDGALAAGRSWFAGWRWLVPITSVAAMALVAVWIGRNPSDQVANRAVEPPAEQAAAQGRGAELAREAAPAVAPTPAATPAEPASPARRLDSARDMAAQARRIPPRTGAEGKAEADRQADRQAFASPAEAAAPARPSAADERLGARSDEARAKATAAESTRAAQLVDAAAAPPPFPAPAAGGSAPAPAPASAPAPPATAGRAANAVGAARAREAVMATLTGIVTYRPRVALPAGAVVEVRLLDVSGADTLARVEIVTRGEQVPVAFSLPYDPDAIQPRRRYVVHATIAVGGRVAWRTTTQHPVFVDGAAPASAVTIVVDQIR